MTIGSVAIGGVPAFDPQAIRFSKRHYVEVGQMIHLTKSGEPRFESKEWTNFLSRTFQSLRDFFTAINRQSDVVDHAMSGFVQLVQTQVAAPMGSCHDA